MGQSTSATANGLAAFSGEPLGLVGRRPKEEVSARHQDFGKVHHVARRGYPCADRKVYDSGHRMTAPEIIPMLSGVRARGENQWIVRCPNHEDDSPSLSIKQIHDRVLIYCWAGCKVG